MTKLYLDDARTPTEEGWTVVRDFDEFANYIKANPVPEVISFDHDLHPEHYNDAMYKGQKEYSKLYKTFKHPTGLGCAVYVVLTLRQSGEPIPQFNIHSQNPAGRLNIKDYLMVNMLLLGDMDPEVTLDEIPFKYD